MLPWRIGTPAIWRVPHAVRSRGRPARVRGSRAWTVRHPAFLSVLLGRLSGIAPSVGGCVCMWRQGRVPVPYSGRAPRRLSGHPGYRRAGQRAWYYDPRVPRLQVHTAVGLYGLRWTTSATRGLPGTVAL